MTERDRDMAQFVAANGWSTAPIHPLAGDASFRRYHRLGDGQNAILMDAPPGHEDVAPFIAVARYLKALGYSSPEILAADIANGFVLLEDLGDDRFSALLAAGRGPDEQTLYEAAVDLLVELQRHSPPAQLPVTDGLVHDLKPYDGGLLLGEANLFVDWYLPALTGQQTPSELRQSFETLWSGLFALGEFGRPRLVLRDYHADNLMWLGDRQGVARVGLLDFQDAVVGCPVYDLVSLLQDARREVPLPLEQQLLERYFRAAPAAGDDGDRSRFLDAYYMLGAQRNTKIIGIFTRLWRRDGKPAYLDFIGRVWGRLERDLEHPALAAAKDWFGRHVPPDMRRRPSATGTGR